ncbi:MAG TPA: GNAT family protein [Nitrospiraceae bacterium]|nr:GNAT family protein [Nitrospiraceae bacterium]
MTAHSLTLRQLTNDDAVAVRQWPSYPPAFAVFDFALREGGWLDQFPESPRNHRYAAWQEDILVGFSILADIIEGDAEFYLALHPDHVGQGLGEWITRRTLLDGFGHLGLSRIHLKVRDWHETAISIYTRVGFTQQGTCVLPIQGQPVHFIIMEIFPDTIHI